MRHFYQKLSRHWHVRHLLAVIGLAGLLVVLKWGLPLPQKQSTPTRLTEIPEVNEAVSPRYEKEIRKQDLANFLSGLKQTQPNMAGQYDDRESQHKQATVAIEIQRTQQATQYQQLLTDFNQAEGNAKILLLQKIWQLAPEVGIDAELLTLLQLATYEPDTQLANMASQMLHDLTRLRDGMVSPAQQLVAQLAEMDQRQQRRSKPPGEDAPLHRSDKTAALKALALNAETPDTKDYALNNLMQFDQAAALEAIQYQLLNSKNSDERFKAVERLRSSIGDYDSTKIRQILELVSYDYDEVIAENARATLGMLDDYALAQSDLQQSIQENGEPPVSRDPQRR